MAYTAIKSRPVFELVLLSSCILLRHLLLNLLICPAIKDTGLDLIQHLRLDKLIVSRHTIHDLPEHLPAIRTTQMF